MLPRYAGRCRSSVRYRAETLKKPIWAACHMSGQRVSRSGQFLNQDWSTEMPKGQSLQINSGELTVVCAWCARVLVEGDASQPVSHGICGPCAKDWR